MTLQPPPKKNVSSFTSINFIHIFTVKRLDSRDSLFAKKDTPIFCNPHCDQSLPTADIEKHIAVSTEFLADRLFELSNALIKDKNQSTFWIGINEDQKPEQLVSKGGFAGPLAAAALRGYISFRYLGEFRTAKERNLVGCYRFEDSLQTGQNDSFFVGRDREMTTLEQSFQNFLKKPSACSAIISGFPGAGKSSIIKCLRSRWEAEHISIETDCYLPGMRGGETIAAISNRSQPLPERVRTFENAHLKTPRVWLIEDCHWMPKMDWELLQLVSSRSVAPVFFILTTRNAQESTIRLEDAISIPLKPLQKEEITLFIKEKTGTYPSQETVEDLTSCAQGSPLLLQELLQGWLARRILVVRKGLLQIDQSRRSEVGYVDTQQLVNNQLLRIAPNFRRILSASALISGTLDPIALAKHFPTELRRHASSLEVPFGLYFDLLNENGKPLLRCRHEEIRLALISLIKDNPDELRLAAIEYERERGNWLEVHFHYKKLKKAKISQQRETLSIAFQQAWDQDRYEQCLQLLPDCKKQYDSSFPLELSQQIGLCYYRVGNLLEASQWLERVAQSERGSSIYSSLAYLGRNLRKTQFYSSRVDRLNLKTEALHLLSDISYNESRFVKSAVCVLRASLSAGALPWPHAGRSEIRAAQAIIVSSHPVTRKRWLQASIKDALKESSDSGNKKSEMRARMLISIALLGSEHWQQAHKFSETAYRWAQENNAKQLELQAGITACVTPSFCDNREEALQISEELFAGGLDSGHTFLSEFIRTVHACQLFAFQSPVDGYRLICERKPVPMVDSLQKIILAACAASSGDLIEARENVVQTLEVVPASYGLTTLFEFNVGSVLQLWSADLLPWNKVCSVYRQLARQGKAFHTAKAFYQAWKALLPAIRKNNYKAAAPALEKTITATRKEGLHGHAVTLQTLGAILIPEKFTLPENPRPGDLVRYRGLATQLQSKHQNA